MAGQGGAAWAAYLQQKNATEKNYQNAFSQVDSIATAEGVQAERPSIHSGLSTAQYEEQLNKYLENVNTGVFKRDVTNTLKDVQKQGQASGVNVALPAVENLTQENAQAEIDKYVNTVNAHVYAKSAVTACNDLAVQAQAYGVTIAPPKVPTTMTQAEAQNLINNYQSQVNSALLTKSTKDSIDGVAAQAKSYGVQVSAPVVPAGISQQAANAIIDKYVAQVNTAVLVKSTRTALLDIQSQARNYGLTVAMPTISNTITEAAANALIDKYVADVNAQLSATPETVSASETSGLRTAAKSNNLLMTTGLQTDAKSNTNLVGSSGLKTSAKVNANLVGASLKADVKANTALVGAVEAAVAAVVTASVAKGADGSLAVSESLYNQLKVAQTKYADTWNDYSGIPEQVINSQATDVRINSDGQFEWSPVTAADKKQLADINAYRKSSGLSLRTTLVLGPEKSNTYNTTWYTTGGNRTQAAKGSGGEKLAAMRASSPEINANASAKVNTAQTIKAVTITAKEAAAIEAAAHPGQVKLKDGTWINQVEKQGIVGKGGIAAVVAAQKSLEELGKQYQDKLSGNYNPVARRDITSGDVKTVMHGTVVDQHGKAQFDKKIADAKAFKAQINAFDDVLKEFGAVSIQTKGHIGTGERGVFVGVAAKDANGKVLKNSDGSVKYIARSQTAADYKKLEKETPKLAKTAILAGMSAADVKAVESARERMLLGLDFAKATRLKTEWRETDYNAGKALKLYNSASGKYNVVDFDSFSKEFAGIEKATKGMSDAEKRKYLLDVENSKLPSSGKASDFWRTLNTDITTALKIDPSMAGVLDGIGGKKAVTVKWDTTNARVDSKLGSVIKSGSISDVIDNISNKQVNGKPLTATEVSLLSAISAGYKPGETTAKISAFSTKATEAVQKKMQTYQKTYKGEGKVSTTLAEWANDLQNGAITAVGVVGATVSGVPHAAGYVGSQVKDIKSYDSAKNAYMNVGLSAGIVGTQMSRGMAKSYHEDKSKFVAELVLTQALFTGAGKATKYGVTKPAKQIALKTGVTRTKTLTSEIIPYKEVGTILDDMRAGKQITGMHATVYRQAKGKKVFANEPGKNPKYAEPGTFGHKGRFSTVSDGIVEPAGEYFLGKLKDTRIAKTAKAVLQPVNSKVINPITGKAIKVLKSEWAKPSTRPVTLTDRAINWTGKQLKNNFEQNLNKVTTRHARLGEKAIYKVSGDPVKLTENQWNRVYKQFAEKGEFWGEYEKIAKIAQKQADKSGKPVAIPSPKSAKGLLEAESEVWWVDPSYGVKLTSSQVLGRTTKGVKIIEAKYGKQTPVVKKSVAQRMKENREYNKQMVKAIDGKKYNLNHIKSYANDANRRLGELYGSKTTRPGAYEGGHHGKGHTEQVGKNVASLGIEQETAYWLGVMHDVTKIGPHESAGIPHAIAAAEVIKRGMITDARFNKFYNGLSKAKQREFYKAVGEHTTIKPINRHLLTEWDLSLKKGSDLRSPIKSVKGRVSTLKQGIKTSIKDRPSKVSKALANADRMDLVRFGSKIQKRQMFGKLKDSAGLKVENKVKNTVKAGSKKLAGSGVKTKVRNALKSETRTATLQNKVKVINKKTVSKEKYVAAKKSNTAVKKQYRKPEQEYAGNKYTQAAKAYGSLAAYNNSLTAVDKYLQPYNYKANRAPTYTKPVTHTKTDYKAGYKQPKDGAKSGYYKPSKKYDGPKYKPGYGPKYAKGQSYKPSYASRYGKAEYSGKYANSNGEYKSAYGGKYEAKGYSGGYGSGYGSGYGNGYSGGYGGGKSGGKTTALAKMRIGTQSKKLKSTDKKHMQRKLKNVLGSMDSLFGTAKSSKLRSKPKAKARKA